MTERKQCVRCQRPIDRYAKLCVYCNWDQSATVPATPEPVNAPAYVPPADHQARNRLLAVVALVGLVIIAFVVGTLIHGFEPNEVKAASNKEPGTTTATTTAPSAAGPHSDVTLVPVTESGAAPAVEPPITSAPPQAPDQEANDATALPSDQYAAVAAKAKAQKASAPPVDPRSVRGRAYEDDSTPKMIRRDVDTHAVRTEAFLEYRPLPSIHVDRDTSARLALTVGADGGVKDVNIIDPIPGATPQLVGAIQNWRFRPATINGTPVAAKVTVTITLRANE